MTRNWASSSIATVLVLAALVGAGPALADGGFSVSPARIDARVQPGTLLPPIYVRNDTSRTLTVTAEVLLAGQDLSGLPTWKRTAATLRDGRQIARVSPGSFQLAPHIGMPVRLRIVAGKPRRGHGTYGVLLVSATPAPSKSARRGSMVATRVRLSANLLLRYGTGGTAAVSAKSLRAGQGAHRSLVFAVGVKNSGSLHGRPAANLGIRDAAGRIVASKHFASGNILPGASRELLATVTQVLPAGDYIAQATVRLGGHATSQTSHIHLVAPGTLPTPNLQIASLPVPKLQPSDPVAVTLGLHNAGTAAARVDGVATLGRPGGAPRVSVPIKAPALAAGADRDVQLRLPAAGPGDHELSVILRDGNRVIATRSIVFSASTPTSLWNRLRDWASANVGTLIIGMGVLLLLVGVGAAIVVRRALRRAHDRALKAALAAADRTGGGSLPTAFPPHTGRQSPLIDGLHVPGLTSPGLDDPQRAEARRPGCPEPEPAPESTDLEPTPVDR